jgi:transglutaminase-like putative cysteine protease
VQAITTAIFCAIDYRRREEAGVQSPATTLRLGTGSCRDMATLGMEAARSLGIPARFVSGYLNSLSSLAGRGCTHAWFDAYLPDCGWLGFDSTSGKPTNRNQIPIGVSSHPRGVMPISGKFDNSTGTSLGMSVAVTIRHEEVPELLKAAA